MKYLLCVLFVFTLSCNWVKTKEERIIDYIGNYLNIPIKQGNLFLILPTRDTCNTCLIATREFLIKKDGIHKNIYLIYIGNSKKELQFLSEGLSEKYNVIFDTKNAGVIKGVVRHYAVLIDISKSQTTTFEFSTSTNWDKMKEKVNTLINTKQQP